MGFKIPELRQLAMKYVIRFLRTPRLFSLITFFFLAW